MIKKGAVKVQEHTGTCKGKDLDVFFSGRELYGDDLGPDEIAEWYHDEKEGYACLVASDAGVYGYVYHAMNVWHGFRHLPPWRFSDVLGFGSAYGEEFEPIAARLNRLTIVDPSDTFKRSEVFGIPVEYVRPRVDGTLEFEDDSFDLITCFGVLHHIPNVSHVVGELYRCLRPGGYALVREPVISLGDWRRRRPGLTTRERGIPLPIFHRIMAETGFIVVRDRLCMFPLIPRLWEIARRAAFNSSLATGLDEMCCRLLRWNLRYHATNVIMKLRPTSVFVVLTKQ
ncbi:MAG: class I SAM-dependent methyltransferase [Planctomycetes bacterium]|nr:class I SAM-dependent methyltransferase [Planctomycetota bacterium]